VQALAAVLGGTQSLHTNGFDEALGLPTERAARIALRTQQIVGFESGVVDTPDPLAGSYFVESLTDAVEAKAWDYIARIDDMGGAVAAIEAGYQMDEIEQAAYEYTKSIDDGERVIVGVNRFTVDDDVTPDIFPIDPALQRAQVDRVKQFRADRDQAAVTAGLDDVRAAARGTQNLLHPMRAALAARATLGEVSDALRDVFGEYRPG
jgi:methylmalonyl-CoA mutase N-terminal domain/subunit